MMWLANIDMKPIMSKRALRDYITKYATKAEKNAPAFLEILSSVVNSMAPEGSAESACQKLLNKMLGERAYSAQETAHLLQGIPLVHCSVSFKTLNLG